MRHSTHVLGRRATRSSCQRRRCSPSTKIVAESSKRFSSDVSLGERKPNQGSPSSNGTLTLTGAPLTGTRAATYWQRQRGTRKRRRVVRREARTRSCCGIRGYWKCFYASPKKLIDMPGCGNSTGTTHSSYQKAAAARRQNFTFHPSKLKIFETFASDGCTTSHT